MKQFDIIQLYTKLDELASVKGFSNSNQWDIYKLRKELRKHVDFQQERENAIIEKYTPYADDKGMIYGEHYENYQKDINDLNNIDVDLKIEKIKLPLVDGINFKTIENLEDFIEFYLE